MSIRCLNCDSEISTVARVCPYCHLSPYDPFAPQPYPEMRRYEGRFPIDPMAAGVLGVMMLPVFPIAGAIVLGVGILGGIVNRGTE